MTYVKGKEGSLPYARSMNQAVATSPVGLTTSNPSPLPQGPDAHASAPAAAWWGAHRGPLDVTDDFSVLDDPVEQATFTETIVNDGAPCAESVLMVQGM